MSAADTAVGDRSSYPEREVESFARCGGSGNSAGVRTWILFGGGAGQLFPITAHSPP